LEGTMSEDTVDIGFPGVVVEREGAYARARLTDATWICPRCEGRGGETTTDAEGYSFWRPCACGRELRKIELFNRAGIGWRYRDATLGPESFKARTDLQEFALVEAQHFVKAYPKVERGLVFCGPVGSGKTHLLCAIARELINQDKRIFFTPCSMLVQDLLVAKRELELPKILKKFSRFDALLIDDIGYVQQSREEMEVLFTLLAYCYERSSVMLTSNLPFSQWEKIFKDPMTTAAAIDRLVHHSVILEMNIESYRLEKAKKRKEKI
jgi:DNA replication protein DnaC